MRRFPLDHGESKNHYVAVIILKFGAFDAGYAVRRTA
jgi:hypothetical protein